MNAMVFSWIVHRITREVHVWNLDWTLVSQSMTGTQTIWQLSQSFLEALSIRDTGILCIMAVSCIVYPLYLQSHFLTLSCLLACVCLIHVHDCFDKLIVSSSLEYFHLFSRGNCRWYQNWTFRKLPADGLVSLLICLIGPLCSNLSHYTCRNTRKRDTGNIAVASSDEFPVFPKVFQARFWYAQSLQRKLISPFDVFVLFVNNWCVESWRSEIASSFQGGFFVQNISMEILSGHNVCP